MHHWIVKLPPIFDQVFAVNMNTLITMWLCMGVLIILAILSTRKLSIVPGKAQFLGEKVMEALWGFADSTIEKDGRKHVPLLASLFLFILTANLCGQIPWRLYHLKEGAEFAAPTSDINLTVALAVIVLVYYAFQGFRLKGYKFIIHEFSFVGVIMALVELMDFVTRPLALSLRLFANILAGEILVVTFISFFPLFLPLPIMLFELMVAFIQAAVFTMLSAIYIGLATQPLEEH